MAADSGVALEGQGLSGPQPYNLQNGKSYQLYTYENISAGESVQVAFKGKPVIASTTGTSNSTLPLALGGVILGLTMVGVGFWWWRRPDGHELTESETTDLGLDLEHSTFNEIIAEIARLDDANEQGLIEPGEHKQQRQKLMSIAKENFPEEF